MNHHHLLIKGVEEFNKREFFESHETLEEYWNTLFGDEKELVQSIIQAAVAYYHIGRGNRVGARKLLVRAVRHAQAVADGTLGIDVSSYLKTIKHSLKTVESDDALNEIPPASIRFKSM
ncbi:MAG: DUF309 domain-containing protein [Candidatus Melainabacteria bacterium]|nr:DUF309 domain-containing protein [Candidatus Melainabacteria bacterium]